MRCQGLLSKSLNQLLSQRSHSAYFSHDKVAVESGLERIECLHADNLCWEAVPLVDYLVGEEIFAKISVMSSSF